MASRLFVLLACSLAVSTLGWDGHDQNTDLSTGSEFTVDDTDIEDEAFFTQALSGNIDVDLGQVDSSSLKRSLACARGSTCKFAAKIKAQTKEIASDASSTSCDPQKEVLELHVAFTLTSVCGPEEQHLFRLDVTSFKAAQKGKAPVTGENNMIKYPCVFRQRANGRVEKAWFSKAEDKFDRSMKMKIIRGLAKHTHPKAVEQAMAQKATSFVYEGSEASGDYVATARILPATGGIGDIMVVEDRVYKEKSKTKHSLSPGGAISMKQKRKVVATLDATSHIVDFKEKDEVSIGSNTPPNPKPKIMVPSTGQTKITSKVHLHMESTKQLPDRCVPAPNMKEEELTLMLQDKLEADLEGAEGEQLDEIETAPIEPTADVVAARAQAIHDAIEADPKADISIPRVSEATDASTAERLVDLAVSLCEEIGDSPLSRRLVAGVAAVRVPAALSAVVNLIEDDSVPHSLREQAAVALVPPEDTPQSEASCPTELLERVSSVAARDDDFAPTATLLLGSLLSLRPDLADRHLGRVTSELGSISDLTLADAPRANMLLSALGNTHNSAFAPHVLPFATSDVQSVQETAIDALERMGASPADLEPPTDLQLSEAPADVVDELDLDDDNDEEEAKKWSYKKQQGKKSELPADVTPNQAAMDKPFGEKGWESQTFLAKKNAGLSGDYGSNFQLKAMTDLVAKYNNERFAAWAKAALTLKVFKSKTYRVAEAGAVAEVQPAPAKGIKGDLDLYLNIAGHRIKGTRYTLNNKYINLGGECPESLYSTAGKRARGRVSPLFQKSFIALKVPVPISFIPGHMTVTLHGFAGYEKIFATYINCKSPEREHDFAALAGLAGHAKLDLEIKFGVGNSKVGAGIVGTLTVFNGNFPATMTVRTKKACGRQNSEVQSLAGSVVLYAHLWSFKKDYTLLKWNGKYGLWVFKNVCTGDDFDMFPWYDKLGFGDRASWSGKSAPETKVEALIPASDESSGKPQQVNVSPKIPNRCGGQKSLTAKGALFGSINELSADAVVGEPINGCTDLTNDVQGKVAVLRRGGCDFIAKAFAAQRSGAVGVIVINKDDNKLLAMSGTLSTVKIPAVMVTKSEGDALACAIQGRKKTRVKLPVPTPTALGLIQLLDSPLSDVDEDEDVESHGCKNANARYSTRDSGSRGRPVKHKKSGPALAREVATAGASNNPAKNAWAMPPRQADQLIEVARKLAMTSKEPVTVHLTKQALYVVFNKAAASGSKLVSCTSVKGCQGKVPSASLDLWRKQREGVIERMVVKLMKSGQRRVVFVGEDTAALVAAMAALDFMNGDDTSFVAGRAAALVSFCDKKMFSSFNLKTSQVQWMPHTDAVPM